MAKNSTRRRFRQAVHHANCQWAVCKFPRVRRHAQRRQRYYDRISRPQRSARRRRQREVRHGHEHARDANALRRHNRAHEHAGPVPRQNQDRHVRGLERENFLRWSTRTRSTKFFHNRKMKFQNAERSHPRELINEERKLKMKRPMKFLSIITSLMVLLPASLAMAQQATPDSS